MKRLGFTVALAAMALAPAAQAAIQCFPGAGTYGAVSVTLSGDCEPNFAYSGTLGIVLEEVAACTLTFSKPLVTSSFTIHVGDVNLSEVTTVSTDAGAYSVQPADLSPTGVYPGPEVIEASAGEIVHPTGAARSSGRLRFISAPPASITSLTFTHRSTTGLRTIYRVCADDAGAVVAPTAVPTMSEWTMILLGVLLAGGAAVYIQRRRLPA